MNVLLDELERRVLGVLIEKSLAASEYYPLTLNLLVSGSNQKSNRDPVLTLDEDSVWNILERLIARGWVTRVLPGGSSRVDRFRHEIKTVLGLEKPAWPVLAELLLRGPQTLGELRTHCQRMYPFENLESVRAVLDGLVQRDPPLVEMLPREAGHSAVRFGHCMTPPTERPNTASPAPAPESVLRATTLNSAPSAPASSTVRDDSSLLERVAALEQRVAALEARSESRHGA